VRCVLSSAGLAVILFGAVHITSTSQFPAPWALAPVLGAVLVIAAGVGATGFRFSPLLSNPASRYLGDISYSLYLWHFPVIILLGSLIRPSGAKYYAMAAGIILLASVLSFHLVENPVRRSSWLDGGAAGTSDRRQHRVDGVAQAAGAVIIVVALVAAVVNVSQNPPVQGAGNVPALPTLAAKPGAIPRLSPAVTAAGLRAALTAKRWPAMDLSHDALVKLLPEALQTACFNGYPSIDKQCTFGPDESTHTAVIFGDSLAMAFVPMISAALPSWKIVTFGKASCPWADALVSTATENAYTSCLDFHKAVYPQIVALHPTVVFVSGSENSIASLTSKAKDAAAQDEWALAEKRTLTALSAAPAPIYVLSPAPGGLDIATCATRFNGPKDCNWKGPGTSWLAEQSATSAAIAGMTNVKVIDTSFWVCIEGECPATYGDSPTRADGEHLTEQFATHLASNFLTAARNANPKLFATR
jgi:hypothetical protein